MPKLKTKSSAKKRFRFTAKGKIKMPQAGKRHGMIKRTNSQIRKQRGILLTMFDKRNKLSSEVDREARNFFKDKVYQTVIQRNVRLSEAPSHGLPCVVYDKNCVGSKSYFKLAEEFLKKNQIESAA